MSALIGTNLLVNPGAEAGAGVLGDAVVSSIPGWTTTGNFSVVTYGTNAAYPLTAAQSAAYGGGANYFVGGPESALSTASQTISLAPFGAALATGTYTATISGYLGGYQSQDDNMDLSATFLDSSNNPIVTDTLDGPLAAARGDISELLFETETFAVPANATSVQFTMTATRREGSDDDGYADNVSFVINSACFAAGTAIRTPSGERPVERIAAGDDVLTQAGQVASVRWVGHRHVDCNRHPRPRDVLPILVHADAFGKAQPRRPLLLSPDHAVFVDGFLIPIRYLVNGKSIAQQPRDVVTYWHIELDRHDVILAEGLPCETYLDTGNRGALFNNGPVSHMHPDVAPLVREAQSCAPLVIAGPSVDAVRRRLRRRATMIARRHPVEPARSAA